ncbi:pyridoxamine 5'-phosphate oxidase family protein [Blastococcus sp. TML/M2B]|nr:pyridoxamine 5'-phosphate oxidase family protein [Blastococcus sp. TML/M2B]
MPSSLDESSAGQRRGRRIAMSPDEVDAFLREERTCRVGTVGPDGAAHVSPLWFVWDGTALWLHSLVRAQRWADLQRDPRVTVLVDAGVEYTELRGVESVRPRRRRRRRAVDGAAGPCAGRAGAAVRRQVRRWAAARRQPARLAADRPGEAGQLGLPQELTAPGTVRRRRRSPAPGG